MTNNVRLLIVSAIVVLSGIYVFPWEKYDINPPIPVKPYRFGLDLHGWVELDYKVDLEEARSISGTTVSEVQVIEWLKSIIDKRVNSLWLAEPTIQTARYGDESHIIVQIPTQDYEWLTEEQKKVKNLEDIQKAKETIGKVVKLEFREEKKEIAEVDKAERRALAEKALGEIKAGTSFDTVGQKYSTQYENIGYVTSSGALPAEARFDGLDSISAFPYMTDVVLTHWPDTFGAGSGGEIVTLPGNAGYAIVKLDSMKTITGSTASGETTTKKEYEYSLLFVDERPSLWAPAQTADGKILNDKYLLQAGMSFTQAGAPQVDLLFNDEGKKIFAELTKRLIGKPIAIYVWGELLTAPVVQSVIPDGRAVITGQYTIDSAQKLANDINTGIVPAPIYLTSERTIDGKIGKDALTEILYAGIIGLVAIIVFLTIFYRFSGILAGVALIIYAMVLIAIVKYFWVVLSLASIAGVILSIGLAIDANILIFERMKEALRAGHPVEKAMIIGFDKSWTAIWDSHITSLTSAVILYIFGISLIKGFGLMLGLGIVLSLFTAMWVSRVIIMEVGKRWGGNMHTFVGLQK